MAHGSWLDYLKSVCRVGNMYRSPTRICMSDLLHVHFQSSCMNCALISGKHAWVIPKLEAVAPPP